jgi:hypothetical protein
MASRWWWLWLCLRLRPWFFGFAAFEHLTHPA